MRNPILAVAAVLSLAPAAFARDGARAPASSAAGRPTLASAVVKAVGGWTVDPVGYRYVHLTGANGEGATLGDFEGRATGLGPTVGWSGAYSRQPVVFGGSWFHEVEVENRVQGHIVFLRVTSPSGTAGSPGAKSCA